MDVIQIVLLSLSAVAVSALVCCLPGLHIYAMIAFLVLHAPGMAWSDGGTLLVFAGSLIVCYSIFSFVPSVLLSVGDESSFFAVLPGQKLVREGRGYEAVLLCSVGSLAGLAVVLVVSLPFFWGPIGVVFSVFRPHMRWILWCVICFMLMSEWPRGGMHEWGRLRRLRSAWRSLIGGVAVFFLSGLLGCLLFRHSPLKLTASFQGLMPAFIGLFSLPWLVRNLFARVRYAEQSRSLSVMRLSELMHGAAAGAAGGGIAVLLPAVTGGVGGFLAGHALSLRNDRAFLVSQGAARMVYFAGSLMLFLLPSFSLSRGGAVSMLRPLTGSHGCTLYYSVLAGLTIAGGCALLLVSPFARFVIKLVSRSGVRALSVAGLTVTVGLVFCFTGLMGLIVLAAASAIGFLPGLWGTRRLNCLGVILLPVALGV